jgi:hypothetical protein
MAEFSYRAASDNGTALTVTFKTATDIRSGRAGFSVGVNQSSYPNGQWFDGDAYPSSQYVLVPLSRIGAVSGDTLYIDVGFTLTDPPSSKTYASSDTPPLAEFTHVVGGGASIFAGQRWELHLHP